MDGLGWLYGADLPLLSLTFARGLTARALLERMDVDPATVAVRTEAEFDEAFGGILFEDDSWVVSAGTYGPWAWAYEYASWRMVEEPGALLRVSDGTMALSLNANERGMVQFHYAEAAELVVGVNTLTGLRSAGRTGSDPYLFDRELAALGADPEREEYGPRGPRGLFYGLVEGLGAGLPRADLLEHPRLCGRLHP